MTVRSPHWRGVAALASSMVVVAVGGTALGAVTIPAPERLPRNTVAVVSHVPVSLGRITKAEFQRALAQSAGAAGLDSTPRPGAKRYEKLKRIAIEERLNVVWLEGQAAEMGIVVTARQVSRLLASLKKQAFKSKAEYHEFLKESRYTRRDVRERVKAQLLSTRIQGKIELGLESESERRKAFTEFVSSYESRWKARTICAPRFTIERCSNWSSPAGGG